jgi:hypothetical protein
MCARFQLALVFIVVAINAQQFPVAAIGRIIVMVVVPVMDRQFTQAYAAEFPPTAAANPRIDLQRLLAIGFLALITITAGLEIISRLGAAMDGVA